MTELHGERIELRPTLAADRERLREIHGAPGVIEWWGAPDDGFPLADDPETARFTIWVDGRIAGMVQFYEEPDRRYRHAAIDIFLGSEHHNQGLGSDALRTLVEYLLGERGHHRLTIDPAAENAAAIRCYEKAGFRPVGVMRCAEQGPSGVWRDVLQLELVRPPPPADG